MVFDSQKVDNAIPKEEVDYLIDQVDKNRHGLIDLCEFVELFRVEAPRPDRGNAGVCPCTALYLKGAQRGRESALLRS